MVLAPFQTLFGSTLVKIYDCFLFLRNVYVPFNGNIKLFLSEQKIHFFAFSNQPFSASPLQEAFFFESSGHIPRLGRGQIPNEVDGKNVGLPCETKCFNSS